MKTCASCPSPAKCTAAGKCLKSSAKMGYGGMPKKVKMAKGGMTKANCGASMKPQQSSTPKGK